MQTGGRCANPEKFANAFHVSPAALAITRIADGKFLDVNEAFLRLFEFDRAEVIGHTLDRVEHTTPAGAHPSLQRNWRPAD